MAMMEYTLEEQEQILGVLSAFHDQGIQFVVPRGYRELPERTQGGDIDIIVKSDRFEEAIEVTNDFSFDVVGSRASNIVKLGYRALCNPSNALGMLVNEPSKAYDFLHHAITPSKPENPELASRYREQLVRNDSVTLHLMNHLAYTSPLNGQKIRVDPQVEQYLYNRSRRRGDVVVPAPPDELAHLICRGVFDYEGNFTEYYIELCEELSQVVFKDETAKSQFNELLSLLFFDAAEVVEGCLRCGEYDTIKEELIRYSDY